MAAEGVIGQYATWGKLCKFSIQDGKSVSCDTIFGKSGTPSAGGLAAHPAITFDGKRIAFYRLGATVNYAVSPPKGQLVGTLNDSGWISIIDTNGQNLRNLVRMARTGLNNCTAIDLGPKVLCPSGDWIYYEKTPMTGEVWRVNINDPQHTNERIAKLDNAASWTCSSIGPWGFRRLSINKAATLSAGQIFGQGYDNPICTFPWKNNSLSACLIKSIPGCNGTISAGGHYWAGYNGNHYMAGFGAIKPDASQPTGYSYSEDLAAFGVPGMTKRVFSLGDLAAWAGEPKELKWGNHMRWACNSEKWLLWAGLHYYGAAGMYEEGGMDQAAMNWVDHAGIHISHNVYYDNCITNNTWNWTCTGPAIANLAGDMFIFGGPANSYEKVDGTWEAVAPVGPIVPVRPRRQDRPAAPDLTAYIDNKGNLRIGTGEERCRIDIIKLNGRVALTASGAHGMVTVRAGALRKGVYVVRISAASGYSQMKIAL
jgi:hypothetical protein